MTAGADMVSVRFEYNGYGELTEREDARGATYYHYDKLGRRTCAATAAGTATWEYDQTNGTGLLKPSQLRPGHDLDERLVLRVRHRLRGDVRIQRRRPAEEGDDVDHRRPDSRHAHDADAQHAYDDYGRLASTTYPSSVTVEHEYNDRGYARS